MRTFVITAATVGFVLPKRVFLVCPRGRGLNYIPVLFALFSLTLLALLRMGRRTAPNICLRLCVVFPLVLDGAAA